jgi:phosphoribosylglycinamide formyltransferase 1
LAGNRRSSRHNKTLVGTSGHAFRGEALSCALLAAGDEVTGVSIHLVDEEYDHGEVVAQVQVPVRPEDTPESLRRRVLEVEHSFLPATLQKISIGQIRLP